MQVSLSGVRDIQQQNHALLQHQTAFSGRDVTRGEHEKGRRCRGGSGKTGNTG